MLAAAASMAGEGAGDLLLSSAVVVLGLEKSCLADCTLGPGIWT
jgi:hypothetical protein